MTARRPAVSGVLLAAGLSTRFGATKQLATIDGTPLVRIVAAQACAASLAEVILVVGHDADAVTDAVEGLPVQIAFNPDYREGQSSSVRTGLRRVAPTSAGAMFVPADQPGLDTAILDRLIAGFERWPSKIIVPVYAGARGAPVIFPRGLFPELAALSGDVGGRVLLARHEDVVHPLAFETTQALADIDTPADREAWIRRSPK